MGPRPIALLNISGPYGAGKDTLIDAVLTQFGSRVHRVRTLTTRPSSAAADPSYTTLGPAEFARATSGSNWIVNRQFSGTVSYATDLDEIQQAAAEGKLCVHAIFAGDAGAGELRRRLAGRLVSVGIQVNEGGVDQQLATLRDRLLERGRESEEAIEQRLSHQYEVVSYVLENPQVLADDGNVYRVFDYHLINSDLIAATSEIITIATAAYEGRSDDHAANRL
jgi:ribose 1,5-bisphosphokinase PhnN